MRPGTHSDIFEKVMRPQKKSSRKRKMHFREDSHDARCAIRLAHLGGFDVAVDTFIYGIAQNRIL